MYKSALVLAFAGFLVLNIFLAPTRAAIASCSVSVDPSTVTPGSSPTLNFSVTNSDPSGTVNYVRISAPGGFQISSGGSSGWSAHVSTSAVQFIGGSIAPSSSHSFSIAVTAPSSEGLGGFSVDTSDNEGGSTTSCGSANVTVSNSGGSSGPGGNQPPQISGLSISEVTTNSAKINWTTDEPATSVVEYGQTTAYGSISNDTNMVTNHSIQISGLTINSTYHFKVRSVDSQGAGTETQNATFTTNATAGTSSTPTVITITTTTTATTSGPAPTPTPKPVDKTAPVVSLTTKLEKKYNQVPTLRGSASDNENLSRVEYSTDDGKNWLPVKGIAAGRSSRFEITPTLPDDGNYKIKLRARDLMGNIGQSPTYDLIIDRLPPMVGPSLITIGPQVVTEALSITLVNLEQKITLSAVGGPLKVDLVAKSLKDSSEKTFSLVKNLDNGLWSALIRFEVAGEYELRIHSEDGAENKTEKRLQNIIVLENGQVLHQNQPLPGARVSVFYFEESLQKFILWDARAYSQTNPQRTDANGEYKFLLPPGKFYLEIEAPGMTTTKSQIFENKQTLIVNQKISLNKKEGIWALPLIDFKRDYFTLNLDNLPQVAESSLIGKALPQFNLTSPNGNLTQATILGRPSVISFINSWLPNSSEQIRFLNDLSKDSQVNVETILPQESISAVSLFKKRGGYNLGMFADPDSKLVDPFGLQSLPTHIITDRSGTVIKVLSGVFTTEQLKDELKSVDNRISF